MCEEEATCFPPVKMRPWPLRKEERIYFLALVVCSCPRNFCQVLVFYLQILAK
jgi:hypothetical protein